MPHDILGNKITKINPLGIGIVTPSKKKTDRDTKRSFTQSQKNEICDNQNNKCAKCKKPLLRSATHYDHKIPWEKGGKTDLKK